MGKGNITRYLNRNFINCIGTDLPNFDFLTMTPTFEWDIIVTNPPYSLKNQFLKRCYEYKKPFALLLPINGLETKIRQEMFSKYGLQIILIPYRIKFETPTGKKSSPWQAHCWFTNGLNLKNDIIYSD